jgi:hypothetical protein
MKRRIRIVWQVDLPGGGHATVTDTSPPLAGLDPNDGTAIWKAVRDGLGITLGVIVRTEAAAGDGAAYRVTHGVTGAPGALTVEPVTAESRDPGGLTVEGIVTR